tara:strand:+ start:643 stop:906 length:264 start_codon:yes stop_codon:yes gene_type:complete
VVIGSGGDRSVVDWMMDATDAEIVEVLLMAGPQKAVRVVAMVASRLGPEAAAQIKDAVEYTKSEPVDALARAAIAGIDALSRKRRRG